MKRDYNELSEEIFGVTIDLETIMRQARRNVKRRMEHK